MRSRAGWRLALLVTALVVAGQWLRSELGLHPSVDAVRAWAEALGWHAPAAFFVLVVLRQLILLPAVVLLTAGGFIFGGPLGTMLGGTAIIISGVVNFGLARRIGDTMVPAEWRARLRYLTTRGATPVALFTGVATLHPVGPLMAAHWTAGCSTLATSTFLAVVVPASYARAAALATFGSTIGEWGSSESLLMTGVLLAAVIVPLAVPRLRRRLFEWPATPSD
ncbi:MAG: TVP38/TMEM64 family protein [Deltaproteobacteria bacterium]|nr:TVP38/TMEM64 family protein [Deltaproteobacteria bacterium]